LLRRRVGAGYPDWYSYRGALVQDCPSVDLIRVWPLPVKYPWFEDTDGDEGGPVLRLCSRSQETDGAVPIVITAEEVEPLRAALEETIEILADWAAF
jgi:hypothetical protein